MGFLLKSRVSEICVKRICVNHGVDVRQRTFLACKIKSAQGICHFAKDCTYKEQMRSAHVLARMIDRNAVASGSYFVVGSIVIGLKVISNNPLDNLPTKCPLQSSKAYKQVGSITLSEWLEMYIRTIIYFCIQRTSSRTCS